MRSCEKCGCPLVFDGLDGYGYRWICPDCGQEHVYAEDHSEKNEKEKSA